MDYKFTFQDGSEALMHFGIKGMKWGVWNAETAARRRGGGVRQKTSKTEVLMKQKDQRYQAMKTGYADGKRLRKKNNIKTGPTNIAKDTDEIDSVYKQALYEYKFNKGSNAVGVKEYGEGLLSGLTGAKDPSNEYKKLRTGAYEGGSSKSKRSTAAQTARYERVGRVKGQGRMPEVGGKTYKQSHATSKAQRKAAKYLRLSVEKPSASNTVKAQAWQNKAVYEQRRDMGRSRGTRTAKGIGYGLASLGGAAIGAGVATGQIPIAAVGAGTVAAGKTVVTKAMRREYKAGYRLETGKTRISQEKMDDLKKPKLNSGA